MSTRAVMTTAVVAIAGATIVLGASLLAGHSKDVETVTNEEVTPGPTRQDDRVFAIRIGDPVNVDLVPGAADTRCVTISGDPYLSSTFCPQTATIRSAGAFTVLSPVEGEAPSLVVGFLPVNASRVAVTAGDSSALGESRGALFLAVLAPHALGPAGDVPVTVEFG